jgi:flagella basal body P-ring formation protein FlgA
MKCFAVGLLFAVAAIASAEEGQSENTVVLHQEVYVKGPAVYLSDVADIKGDAATVLGDIELTPAASPGRSRRVDAALVRTRLRDAGIDPSEVSFDGARSVVAKTLYLDLTKEMIAEDLRMFIMGEMPWAPEDAVIDITASGSNTVIPDGDVVIVWRAAPQYRWAGSGTFRGEIHVDGVQQTTLVGRANIDAYVDVVVAQRDLPRGKLLSATDFRIEKRVMSKLTRSPLDDIEAAVGSLARNPIYPGDVVTTRHLRPRVLIKRNTLATVQTQIGSLMVTGRARALTDGHAGDAIMLVNPQSKKEITGVVQADGTVVVD